MKKLCLPDGQITQVSKLGLEPDATDGCRAIVDFAPLPTSQPTLVTRTEIALKTAAETSKKGVVRIMIKVDLPYSGLYPSDVATGASNLKFAPNRSIGRVSAHLVLTLPKECVQDIVQQKAGSTGRECALAHVAAVLGMLDTLKPQENGATAIYANDSLTLDKVWISQADGHVAAVGLDMTGLTPKLVVAETARDSLTTLIDRAARGYTPYADVDEVGTTGIASSGV